MFAVKNNSSASTLTSSITNKNADAFIQPKMNENASENNIDVEADQAANQTISKNQNISSSFFSSQPAIKEPEEEVQKQQSEETQQTASETTVIAKSTGGNNTPSKEEGEGEGKLDQQKNEGVSDSKDTSSASTGEGQINSDTTTGADITTTSKTASQSTSNSVEKTEESVEEDKEEGEKEKVKETAIPKAPTRPEDDPAYKAQIKKTEDAKTEKSQHPDPTTKVGEQKAAGHASPASQTKKGNQEAHAESLNAVSEKKREPFTPKGFKEMLKQNLNDLEKQLPKNSDEAKEFRDDKPIDGIKKNISGQVTSESDKLAGPMKQEADKPAPDVGVAPVEATPLPPTNPGTTPKPLDAKASIPKPKTSQEISMEKESQSLDDYMAENEIKDEQLAKSNEPKFTGALEEKNNAQKEAKLAPVKYRKKEKAQLSKAQKTAAADSTQGLDQMQAAKLLSENNVLQNQTTNKDSDKTEKEKIYAEFEKIYNDTKKTVTDSLEKLSDDVDKKFSSEAESAQKSFEKNVEDGLGDIYGWTVVDDWLFGEDTEAIERLFRKEKSKFISKMDTVLDDISVIISDGLNAALDAIAEGKRLSKEKFDSLDESQKKLAEDAFTDFNDQYAELEDTVYEKQEELAQGLAKSYKENVDSLRRKFDEIKEKVSAGWIGAALNALAGVVKAIMKIKDLLLGLLSAAVSAIGAIISDPIGFLSNLISGIKQGFENFGKNIKKNIIQGLIEWLTGSLGDVGIQIPDNLFSLSGIFSLVTQMLGLTWDYFRGLAVKMLGESVVAGMEKAVEIFTIVKDKGVEGLWDYIKEQFSNLKEMVMDAIRDMVITKVIEAGIKWVLGLMSPAGAFVKAAMMIIDIVKFFVERAAQIFELVQAFINSIKALAAGNVSAVAKGIEQALTKAIPVLIGFLASLVGITGLTGKVQKIIKKVRKKIDKAMKKIILKAKKAFNKILGKKKPKKGDAKKIKDDNKNQKPGKITAEDKAKHKKIGTAIKKKLDEKPKKKPKDFKEIYNSKRKIAKTLEDKYQPQLKKGINLMIEFQPIEKDKGDKDIDIKVRIIPNDYIATFNVPAGEEDNFKDALMQALEKVAAKHNKRGKTEDFDKSIGKSKLKDEDLNTAALDEAKAKEANEHKDDNEEDSKKAKDKSKTIHQRIAATQRKYARAAQARHVPNNTFGEGSGDYFIETASNYYIVKKQEGIDNYSYTLGRSNSLLKLLQNAKEKVEEVDVNDTSAEDELTALYKNKAVKGLIHKSSDHSGQNGKNIPTKWFEDQIATSHSYLADLLQKIVDARKKVGTGGIDPNLVAKKTRDLQRIDRLGITSEPQGEDSYTLLKFIQNKNSLESVDYFDDLRNEHIKIALPGSVTGKYPYHAFPLSPEEAKQWYETYPDRIDGSDKSVTFLAAILVEPSRWSVSHITNMLLLDERSNLDNSSDAPKRMKGKTELEYTDDSKVYKHLSMTQQGSDPNRDTSKTHVPTSRDLNTETTNPVPENVTERDLAAIHRNTALKTKLENEYTKEENASLTKEKRVEKLADLIEAYLNLTEE